MCILYMAEDNKISVIIISSHIGKSFVKILLLIILEKKNSYLLLYF